MVLFGLKLQSINRLDVNAIQCYSMKWFVVIYYKMKSNYSKLSNEKWIKISEY